MDYENDIREHVLATLPYAPTKRSELEEKTAFQLLVIYLNWRNRLVPARPRRVHRSRSLECNPLSMTRKADIDRIVTKVTNGEDLTPHLSTRVKNGYESSKIKRNQRPDLDLMLAEWQVHHLHLSSVLAADGFVKRDGPLLFTAFRPDDAYLIDIFEHEDWTREAITHILIDEWPECGFVHEMNGMVGLERPVSEKGRATLRGAGINSPFIERNGKFYMVGLGGITTAGTPMMAAQHARYIMGALNTFANHVANHPEYISDTLAANGLEIPPDPDLHFVYRPDGRYGVIETNTRALFPLPPAK